MLALGLGSNNSYSINGQGGRELFVVLVEGQQLVHADLVGACSISSAGEGHKDGALAEDGRQVIVTGPDHGVVGNKASIFIYDLLSPVGSCPAQIALQAGGNHTGVGHEGQTLRDFQVELQSSNTCAGAIDGVVDGIAHIDGGSRSLHSHIHRGTCGLCRTGNGNLANGQLSGELLVVLVEGQQLEHADLVLACSINGAGESHNNGVLTKGGGQVIVTGPDHGIVGNKASLFIHDLLRPVGSCPAQITLQAGRNRTGVRHKGHALRDLQVELQCGNAFAGGVDGILNGITDICSRN